MLVVGGEGGGGRKEREARSVAGIEVLVRIKSYAWMKGLEGEVVLDIKEVSLAQRLKRCLISGLNDRPRLECSCVLECITHTMMLRTPARRLHLLANSRRLKFYVSLKLIDTYPLVYTLL